MRVRYGCARRPALSLKSLERRRRRFGGSLSCIQLLLRYDLLGGQLLRPWEIGLRLRLGDASGFDLGFERRLLASGGKNRSFGLARQTRGAGRRARGRQIGVG